MKPEPLVFRPRPVARPWGGTRASRRFGWEHPRGEPIGEWWLVSSRAECPTEVAQGPFEGKFLSDLIRVWGKELTGLEIDDPEEFPYLVKILDAETRLSVQLHPSDDLMPGRGKSEAWWVLEAGDESTLLVGLKSGVTLESFFRRAEAGEDVGDDLQIHPARPGRLVEVPPGTIHALGADVLALEVQQNSDTTYRIFDWNRLPPRRLHLRDARLAVSPRQDVHSLEATHEASQSSTPRPLIVSEPFVLSSIDLPAQNNIEIHGFGILVPLERGLRILCEGHHHHVQRAHGALLPPGPTYRIISESGDTVSRSPSNPVVWITPRPF